MIPLKSAGEVEAIGRAGAIIGELFEILPGHVSTGDSTADIDAFVDGFIRDHEGARPSFKGLYGFPANACISVNDEVVHGIPRPTRNLGEGDIVSVDVGVVLDGWFADAAVTLPVGGIDAGSARLLQVTEDALWSAIERARPGTYLGDLGAVIQQRAEAAGYTVVRELVGHGIGRAPHEEPQVPNFGRPGQGLRLQAGMVLAIEPMVNEGGAEVRTLDDHWTVVTRDGRRSAHFEHTVAITVAGCRVLTSRGGVRPPSHPARDAHDRVGSGG
jgi:methionyl aminopeptidase